MERTLNDSLAQLVRKHQRREQRLKTVIHKVHYSSRRLTCGARGYGVIKRVPVQAGITLGTPDAMIVVPGMTAWIDRQPDNSWLCTSIRTKTRCAVGSSSDEVEIDTALETSVGYTTNDYAATIVPDSLFFPPFESMGEITLPGLALPEGKYDFGDGYNGTIAMSVTQEQLYLAAVADFTLISISLYTVDSNVTLLVDIDGVNMITATRTSGAWTIQGSSAGSADTVAGFTLPVPVPVLIGQVLRSAIVATGAVTGLAYGLGGT